MKTILSEMFLVLTVVVVIALGAGSLKDTIAAEIEEIGIVLEDRRLNKRIMSRLKAAAPGDFRGIVTDVFLTDVLLLTEWLETKSLLSEDQKRRQILECRETLVKKRDHYSTMFRDMSDKQVLKLVRAHILAHDSSWRRRLLTRLNT